MKAAAQFSVSVQNGATHSEQLFTPMNTMKSSAQALYQADSEHSSSQQRMNVTYAAST